MFSFAIHEEKHQKQLSLIAGFSSDFFLFFFYSFIKCRTSQYLVIKEKNSLDFLQYLKSYAHLKNISKLKFNTLRL